MRQRTTFATLIASALMAWGAFMLVSGRAREPEPGTLTVAPSASVVSPPKVQGSADSDPDPAEDAAQCAERPLRLPKGEPATLSCVATRRVIGQVRRRLALPAPSPSASPFAEAVSGWLDPHGMWSAAPDSPVRPLLVRHAAQLLKEIEAPLSDVRGCAAAEEIARETQGWIETLREELGRGARAVRAPNPAVAFALASEGVFQDDPVTRPARDLARDLGRRIESFRRVFPEEARSASAASERLLPRLTREQWSGAVLAAALRAYVPAVDPHGQWAPFEEEWSLYAADPALGAEPRLWGRMTRTALGIRVADDVAPPLVDGDLVLAVAGVATAGLSVEQLEQLAHLESVGGETSRELVVLRRGEKRSHALRVDLEPEPEALPIELSKKSIEYGESVIWVVSVPEVPDELGDELEQLVSSTAEEAHPPSAILLDLRGNGGGSLDGAVGAIGVFLPGVPSFPLRRRDGVVEVQMSSSPPPAARWHGPVAALVDGYTASAAEMIAGALLAYERGQVIGSRTFGKGCVQEYFDDRAGAGVLRLTTMLFSLPDGSALQGVGVAPSMQLLLPAAEERERSIPGALEPWRGPDVRQPSAMGGPEWPRHRGRLGACGDAALCSALNRLGLPRRSASATSPRAPRRASP